MHFINKQRRAVELLWIGPDGQAKTYGMIEPGKTKTQPTRPGAVWAVATPNDNQRLGHFVIGDRTAQAVIPANQPNFVVILTDDLGWSDLGCQGIQKDVKTPHMDALATRGVRCTAGYVTAPQCSPSRAGLITGRHQQRLGIDTIPDMPLPTEAVTIAERLQRLVITLVLLASGISSPIRLALTGCNASYPRCRTSRAAKFAFLGTRSSLTRLKLRVQGILLG